MIYTLRGNTIRDIALPLQELVIEESGRTVSDYYPTSTDKIEVNMVSSSDIQEVDVTVDGKYLHWTWLPTLTGIYGIEVKIVQENGTHMRSYRKQQIRVYNSNDQLPDDDGTVEFISEYLVLDAVTVVWVKGETGNGIAGIAKTSTSGLVDTYTITYTDGSTTTFNVTNGEDAVFSPEQVQQIIDEVTASIHIPTDLSELSQDSTHRLVTDSQISTWSSAYRKPDTGIPASDIADGVIPDVSQFITSSVSNLVNYYKKSETYTKTEVGNLIDAVKQFTYELVSTLPTASASTMHKIYLVPSSEPKTGNVKDEYITIQNGSAYQWEQIGDTSVDLSGYVTTQALNTALGNYTTTTDLNTLLAGYQSKIDSTHKLDYSLIDNTPTIPSQVTETTVSGWGFTKNTGTYSKPDGGIPKSDLASGVQASLDKADSALQPSDISGKEDKTNKVTALSASSTDAQYPSAKCVYDLVGNIETLLAAI